MPACVAAVPIPSVSRRIFLTFGSATNLWTSFIALSRLASVNRAGAFVCFSWSFVSRHSPCSPSLTTGRAACSSSCLSLVSSFSGSSLSTAFQPSARTRRPEATNVSPSTSAVMLVCMYSWSGMKKAR